MNYSKEQLVTIITKKVIEKLSENDGSIPIGISNRHIHISVEDLEVLYGKGASLTKMKDLKQPGQFACQETVTIKGPKGNFERVRILGPTRPETQIEISVSDAFKLGVKPLIRESGQLENTPGIEIIGPKGKVVKEHGTIVALRHIHMPTGIAEELNVKDKEYVSVEVDGIRGSVLKNVLIRVSDSYALEMHLDMDEANSCFLNNKSFVKIIK